MKSLKYDFYRTSRYQSLQVYNNTGSTITAPKVVKLVSYNSTNDIPEITPITSLNDIPIGVLNLELPDGKRSDVIRTGIINNVNTSSGSVLDNVYFDSSGNFTLSSGSGNTFIGYIIQASTLGKVFIDIPYYVFYTKQNNLTSPSTTLNNSGSVNNLDTTHFTRILLSSATTLTGIVAPIGQKNTLIISNTNSVALTISNLSASSDENNKIITGTGSSLTLNAGASILLFYDLSLSKWRIIGGSGTHNALTGLDGGGGGNYYHSNQAINTDSNVQFASLTLSGDLTVNGTTTNINTTNLVVEDKNIILGDVTTPSDTTADGGGITLKGLSDKTLNWVDATDSWTSSENIDVATGKTYKINGTDVLTSTQVLGKSVPTGNIVGTSDGQTLTNKTISVDDNTISGISASSFVLSNSSGNIDGTASQKHIPNGTVVGTDDAQTLSNKTLTNPIISTISNGTGTLTLPNNTNDTLVGRITTDTLQNKTLQGVTVTGDIVSTGTAIDFDLIDDNTSALSFDTTGKTGILEIDTTNSSEKVKMSGGLDVTGTAILKGLTYPTTDGTAGQAIITNGSGILSFGTVAGGGSAGLTYQITSAPLGTLKVGMPVYWNGTAYAPANASTNTKIPTAIVKELNAGDYTVQFGGTLTLTNTQWNQITGGTGGLSTSSGTNTYYLSDINDGQITNVSPIFSIPVLNCIKNDATNSTVEIKFGQLSSTLTNESYSREREVFIANGSTSTFTLTLTPHSRNTTMVTIDGVVQQSDAFSISNKNIVFSGNPPANSEIEVNYVVQKNLSYANIIKHVETTATSKSAFTLPVTPSSESEIMAWVGGSYQDNSNFTLSGNILTFDTNVDSGVKVQFVIFSSIQFTDFPYIKRKTISIGNNSTKNLIDAFGNQAGGRYDFHVVSNPLIGGTIRLQESSPEITIRVETFSSSVSSTISTSNSLNIYINSNNLTFQNLLGSTITLMLERHQ